MSETLETIETVACGDCGRTYPADQMDAAAGNVCFRCEIRIFYSQEWVEHTSDPIEDATYNDYMSFLYVAMK